MTFEQLRALDAVVRCGSVRAAAAHIHKTAPSVSALIRNLEAEIGFEVLSRAEYRPKLTKEGEMFHRKTRLVLDQVNGLAALSQRIAGRREPVISVAINAICPLEELLPLLSGVSKNHATTQFDVSTEHLAGAMERLGHGDADLAITTTEHLDPTRMEARFLREVAIVPVAAAGHELGQISGRISRVEAAQHTQVIVRDSSRGVKKLSHDVVPGARHCHVTDFGAKLQLIEEGLGWGGLPEHVIRQALASGRLVALDVEGFPIRRSKIHAVRRSDVVHGLVAEALWTALAQSTGPQHAESALV